MKLGSIPESRRVLVTLLALAVCFLAGCSQDTSKQKANVADTLEVLERGHAKGHVVITSSGSPLMFGMDNRFWLGPELHFAFDGDIDYGQADNLTTRPANP